MLAPERVCCVELVYELSYVMLSPRGPRSVVPVSLSSVPTALRDPAVALYLTELTNEAIRFRFVIIFESSST